MYFSPKEFNLVFLYNILTYVAAFLLKIIARFNHKIALGVKGRSQTFAVLKPAIASDDKVIWFHCASLGEYEQGLPVFEAIEKAAVGRKIVLSFFSPSGYEIRKKTHWADAVVYLPLDTKSNAKKFLDLIHPELVIFVKYEIWPNYLNALRKREIRTLLISALFRRDQMYFKPQGKWMRHSLHAFEHIFVQNAESRSLLHSFGFDNVSISGDTRFDRVSNQLEIDNTLDFITQFKNGQLCVVAGSTWPEGEALLTRFINSSAYRVKYIIAPHNIKPNRIQSLKASLNKKTVLFSEMNHETLADHDVLIVDTIGLLSKIYSYANIAYVGGAVGNTGLHNTLEAAVFGVPIIIGHQYDNFPEAFAMIEEGGMVSVNDQETFNIAINQLITDEPLRIELGEKNARYIEKNRGAVIQIMDYIRI